MAIENRDPIGHPRDIPRRKGKDNIQDALLLRPETHGLIVGAVVSLTNNHYSFELSAGEVGRFSNAIEVGRIDPDHTVGKEVTQRYKLDGGPYSSFIAVGVFNESLSISDLPSDGKEIAEVGILIDHEIDAFPNGYTSAEFSIRTNVKVIFDLYSYGAVGNEERKSIESELSHWGFETKLAQENNLHKSGILNEKQGRTLLKALRQLDQEL